MSRFEPLRILVVDDEPLIRSGIRRDLADVAGVHVAEECGSVAEAINALRSATFDLVLLDVQMSDGTGFDVIHQFGPKQMPAVVFVTAYDHYAIQAFRVNALDYLLKPFDDIQLKESIERVRDRMAPPGDGLVERLEALLGARTGARATRLVVRNGERFDFVPVETIDWVESANNYSILHCRAKDHLHSEGLTALEGVLDPEKFVRVHRSRIVNTSRIASVSTLAGGIYEIELQSGIRLSSGRQFGDRIRRLLKSGNP